MPGKRLSVRPAFIIIPLLALGGYFGYMQYQSYITTKARNDAASSKQQQEDPMRATDLDGFRSAFVTPAESMHATTSAYLDNNWYRTETTRHEAAIESARYDYIILPVVEYLPNIDRVSRLMPARLVAQEIETQLGKEVLSPELALRVLGPRATLLEDQKVYDLANRTGADIIYLHLKSSRHKNRGNSAIAAIVTGSDGAIKHRMVLEHENVTPERPLDILIAESVSDIVSRLFEPDLTERNRQVYGQEGDFVLPERLTGLVKQATTPLEHAAYLQYIALLTPRMLDYERRRLFERSLLALDHMDPSSSYYNLLMARALFHLYRRPAAMTYVENADSPAEKALRAYLNGNHPDLQELLPQIRDPLLQAAAYLEFVELNTEYLKQAVDVPLPTVSSPGMQALLAAAAKDNDNWYAPANVAFFSKLKGALPEFDKRFEAILAEQMVSGDFELFSDNKGFLEIVFNRARKSGGPACCHSYKGQIEEADLWSLYRNLAVANHFRKLNRSVNVHGSYETAKKLAEQLEPQFQGHPRFTRLYAQALEGYAQSKQGSERAYLLKKAHDLSRQVPIHSGGVDDDTVQAFFLEQQLSKNIPPSDLAGPGSTNRYLPAKEQPSGKRFSEYKSMFSALPFTNEDFYTVVSGINKHKIDDETLQQLLDTRFNGHPEKPVFLAKRLRKKGQSDNALALLRNERDAGNKAWNVYDILGQMLIEDGDYVSASQAFLAYPGFKEPGDKRVRISNHAYDAGSRLFWLGQYAEAEPLYEIAAGLSTGSGAEYAAGQRLAMLQGDWRTAIAYAYTRGDRYNSHYGFRDYLAFMHLLGSHETAEAGFRALAPRYDDPQLWTSLFVGHRMQGRTPDEVEMWIADYLAESGSDKLEEQAMRYALMYSLVDRKPWLEAGPVSSGLDGSHKTNRADNWRRSKRLSDVIEYKQRDGGGPSADCSREAADCGRSAGDNPGLYEKFLAAHTLFKAGMHDDALRDLVSLDGNHNILDSWSRAHFATPYVAMAMVETDFAGKLPLLVATLAQQPKPEEFDIQLTNAIAEATAGNIENALQSLTKAYQGRPHTEWRAIFTWYQLTETAEWLYQKTGDRRFINRALKWAKRYQRIQPQFAWAYAFEALYSNNREERIRAAGFAIYLDPHSAWLEEVPADVRKHGIGWWEKNNPYKAISEELKKPDISQSNEA